MDNSDRKTNLNCSCRIVATHLDANIDIQTDGRTDGLTLNVEKLRF